MLTMHMGQMRRDQELDMKWAEDALVWFPDPSCVGGARKGLGTKLATPTIGWSRSQVRKKRRYGNETIPTVVVN